MDAASHVCAVRANNASSFRLFRSVARMVRERRREKSYPVAEGSTLIQVNLFLDVEYPVN